MTFDSTSMTILALGAGGAFALVAIVQGSVAAAPLQSAGNSVG